MSVSNPQDYLHESCSVKKTLGEHASSGEVKHTIWRQTHWKFWILSYGPQEWIEKNRIECAQIEGWESWNNCRTPRCVKGVHSVGIDCNDCLRHNRRKYRREGKRCCSAETTVQKERYPPPPSSSVASTMSWVTAFFTLLWMMSSMGWVNHQTSSIPFAGFV